mgnify:CR=1 FL=1
MNYEILDDKYANGTLEVLCAIEKVSQLRSSMSARKIISEIKQIDTDTNIDEAYLVSAGMTAEEFFLAYYIAKFSVK